MSSFSSPGLLARLAGALWPPARPVRGVSEASGVDYDRADGQIYWSDIKQKTISRAHSNGSSVEVMVEHGLDYPRGLALDWRSANLYWTDAGTGRLEMISLASGARRVLIFWRGITPHSSVGTTSTI